MLSALPARGQIKIVPVSDPAEVRKLISGKVLDGKYWIFYLRRDGNMAYYYVSSKAMTIRKWTIRKDGKVCSAVFVKPDRVISCFALERSADKTPRYWINTPGIGRSGFRLVHKPAPFLVKAVEAKAGPVK